MEAQKDPFGFKGQAQDYDMERPRYPQEFIDKVLQKTHSFNNYVDVASGTGILFYEIAPKFSGRLIVNDRSKKQLEVAREKIAEYKLDPSRVEFVESDVFDIHKHLSSPMKFDLITVAQALHWFDVDRFCQYAVRDLLAENGVLAILGYFCDGFDYNFPENPEFVKSGQKHYDKYYSTVLPHFDCDRESLDKGHSNFDFKQYFDAFERKDHEVRVELPFDRFATYLGTYSAYRLMTNKLGKNSDFEDPLEKFKTNVKNDLETHYKNYGIAPKEKPIVMRMHFFMLLLSKAKKLL